MSKETTRINELKKTASLTNEDLLLVEQRAGTRVISLENFNKPVNDKIKVIEEKVKETNSQVIDIDIKKMNKNGIITMANMGQDVKEAMTGGSVAVVGHNAILTDNIVDEQITPNKISKELYFEGIDIFSDTNKVVGEYVDASGKFITLDGYTSGRTDYIAIQPNTIYSIYAYDISAKLVAHMYDANKNTLGPITFLSGATNDKHQKFLSNASAKFLIVNYRDTEINVTYLKPNSSDGVISWLKVNKYNLSNITIQDLPINSSYVSIPHSFKSGYYVDVETGVETSYGTNNHGVSDYIPVEAEDMIKYMAYTTQPKYNGIIYDKDKQKIDNLISPLSNGSFIEMKMPLGAKFIRVNYSTSYKPWEVYKKQIISGPLEALDLVDMNFPDCIITPRMLNNDIMSLIGQGNGSSDTGINEFTNMTSTWIGDSITSGVGTTSLSKRYSEVVVKKLGMSVSGYQNLGISASVIARKQSSDTTWDVKSVVERICDEEQIKDNQNIIFCFGGVNDFARKTPFSTMSESINYFKENGTWDDTTFYGALHRLFTYIRTKHSNSQFVFISTIHYDVENTRHQDRVLKQYIEIIREMCEYYAVPLIDLYKNLPLDPKNTNHKSKYAPDGCHPNDTGNELISEYICKWLKSNFVK